MKKPIRGSSKTPDHIMLSINGDPKTSMTVTWRTSIEVTDGYVICRETDGGEPFVINAESGPFKSDIDESRIFWAKINGLKPGTRYAYTCGNESFRSEEYCFKTRDDSEDGFSFLVVSDQQKGEPFECPDYSHFNQIVKAFLNEHPETAFIISAGDSTDCGQHEVQWNGAFSGLKGIVESVPFMMALGNHDNRGFEDYATYTGRYYSEPAEYFGAQFKGSYPDNGPENWKTENYTFDYGNCHIAVIGINGPEEVNEWLIDDIKKSDKDFNIGIYHFPICYTGSNCANYDAYPVMTEGFEMLDVVFSGHEHSYGRSFPRRNEELFDRPSEGTIHFTLGNSNRNPPGTRSLPKVWHCAYYPMEDLTSMLTFVEIKGPVMTVTAYLEDGRVADRCVIDRGRDIIDPPALAPIFNTTRMFFKGADLGLCQSGTPCAEIEGVWYCCPSVLFNYFGGHTIKEKGRIELSAYGHTGTFTENSDECVVDGRSAKLPAPVVRLNMSQLYVPLDALKLYDMRWSYAKRNNFILIEIESEDKPITAQP